MQERSLPNKHVSSSESSMSKVKPIPDGYHTVTSYMILPNTEEAIAFYEKAFDAKETLRLKNPDGSIAHAEIQIGDTFVMLADANPEFGMKSPLEFGGSPCHFMIYVEDADASFEQAVAAGGTVVRPVQDQFYGDRSGMFRDPFGHQWSIATHIEDLSQDDVQKRFDDMMKEAAAEPES